jgi:hypothetical protein
VLKWRDGPPRPPAPTANGRRRRAAHWADIAFQVRALADPGAGCGPVPDFMSVTMAPNSYVYVIGPSVSLAELEKIAEAVFQEVG